MCKGCTMTCVQPKLHDSWQSSALFCLTPDKGKSCGTGTAATISNQKALSSSKRCTKNCCSQFLASQVSARRLDFCGKKLECSSISTRILIVSYLRRSRSGSAASRVMRCTGPCSNRHLPSRHDHGKQG